MKNHTYELSVSAKGRSLTITHRFKLPIVDMDKFKQFRDMEHSRLRYYYCTAPLKKMLKATETHVFYDSDGGRLTSFSIVPADCPKP